MASKKEVPLLKTIEAQKEQLKRYESRLKDLVRAHKGLLKENQALQASVTALTATACAAEVRRPGSDVTSDDVSRDSQASHDSPVENGSVDTQSQLETLTESLQIMVKEKSRMESSFMADRKSLRAELDKCHGELESCRKELVHTRDNLLKMQSDRESETSQYNSALREVQQLLIEERSSSAQLREQCSQQKLQLHRISVADQNVSEVEKVVTRWKQRAEELENTLSDRENHVCRLEEQVGQLSVSLGRRQQQSAADQSAIARLKERLVQIEVERVSRDQEVNSSLTSPAVDDIDRSGTQLLQLVDTAREMLTTSPAEVQTLLGPLRELFRELEGVDSEQKESEDCRQQEDHPSTPEEHASISPVSLQPEPSAQPEIEPELGVQMRAAEEELKRTLERLKLTCEERDEAERALKQQRIESEQQLADLQCDHRSELSSITAAHREQLNQLENRLSSQKLRLTDQLAECQAELHELRRHSGAEATCLDHISFTKQEANILHYVEEVARKDVEISGLRRAKNQLEISLRQLQNKMIDREESLNDQIDFLKERMRRLELNVSREGANLEYIKNVMVRYLLTDDVTQRAHMLNALATSLRFSREELRQCRRTLTASWWPSIAS